MKNRRTTACADSTIGFSPMSDCIASTEFTIRKVEPSSNRDRRFRPPCLRCGLQFKRPGFPLDRRICKETPRCPFCRSATSRSTVTARLSISGSAMSPAIGSSTGCRPPGWQAPRRLHRLSLPRGTRRVEAVSRGAAWLAGADLPALGIAFDPGRRAISVCDVRRARGPYRARSPRSPWFAQN